MNKYRKSNIELLEPYMNKKLGENLLFRYRWGFGNIKWWEDEEFFTGTVYRDDEPNVYICRLSHIRYDDVDIIGHYTLDAVLKYLQKTWLSESVNESNIYYYWFRKESFLIPNKPLHLYTEQEDKELNEILLKLKNDAK